MAMLLQGREHFKTLDVMKTPFIVKKKAQGTILYGNQDLVFPKTARLQVGCIGDKSVVRMLGRLL
jgi:hypothetical protein